ncbi:MAG: FkbM family methyltransferase [Thermoleophilia bacterium]
MLDRWLHGTHHVPVILGPARGHRCRRQGLRGSLAIAAGRYERPVTRFLHAHLEPARVFFDVGAHTGYFTRVALHAMRDGVVVAFEPDRACHQALARLDPKHVLVRMEAVGRSDGTGTLVSAPGSCSRLDDAVPTGSSESTTAATRVRSLDGLLEDGEVSAPDVVKIDVEGSEVNVMLGAARTLSCVQALVVECHSMPLFRDALDQTIRAGFDRIRCTGGGDGVGPPTILASRLS